MLNKIHQNKPQKKWISFALWFVLLSQTIVANAMFHFHTKSPLPSSAEKTRTLNPRVLQLALNAYSCASQAGLNKKQILTIIDYSLPSTDKRLWIINLANKQVLLNTLVAHGRGSGGLMAHFFSDIPSTHESSLGLFLTGSTYTGHNGNSLRLIGLEKGYNEQAYTRDIVIHGAWYASESVAKKLGRLGLSWGCPAVPKNQIKPVINYIKNGTLVFAYYPEKKWLENSKYLHCTGPSYIASNLPSSHPSVFHNMKNFVQNKLINSDSNISVN